MTDITKEAQEIFGDIVVKAESKYWRPCNNEPYRFDWGEYGRNDFDGDEVILIFKDGRIIEIGNSEWGNIRRIDEQTD